MRRIGTFLLSLLACTLLCGQTPAPRRGASLSSYKLIEISITGSKRYSPQQIIPLTGLQLGEQVGEGDFQQASEKLGGTGMFTNVSYTFSYDSAGTRLQFQVGDSDKLAPVKFENFVWFSDAELIEKIHSILPLFQGQLPFDGDLTDRVADVLQELVVARGFAAAKVDVGRPGGDQEKGEAGTIDVIVYSVSGVPVHIRSLAFPGAEAALLPRLQAAAKSQIGGEFQRSRLEMFTRIDLRPLLLSEGKLRVQFGGVQAKVVQESAQEVLVDTSIPITEGPTYKLAGVAWFGNTLFPSNQLDSLVHLHPGDVMNLIAVERNLGRVAGLYRAAGYMRASVKPDLVFDDSAATATCSLTVKEGPQYHMGELDLVGLDEQTKAKLQQAWSLHPGQPYDGAYAQMFLKNTHALFPGDSWKVAVHEAVNDSDTSVDVTLNFNSK